MHVGFPSAYSPPLFGKILVDFLPCRAQNIHSLWAQAPPRHPDPLPIASLPRRWRPETQCALPILPHEMPYSHPFWFF